MECLQKASEEMKPGVRRDENNEKNRIFLSLTRGESCYRRVDFVVEF